MEAAATLQVLIDEGTAKAQQPKQSIKSSEELDALKWELREHVHHLRRLHKELVGRVRSLRYFEAILQFQKHSNQSQQCPACNRPKSCEGGEWAILSCCGHQGYLSCLMEYAEKQECPAEGCCAAARTSSVVQSSSLGCDMEHEAGGKFGTKLKKVVQKINEIPAEDRIIVFVQFNDLAKVVACALEEAGIKAVEVKGSVHTKTKALDLMQQEGAGSPRVILLNLADESASGANLTLCNHAIFIHPMLAESQEHYTACETQAIGRIRRYGQRKTVFIHRYIVRDTIDETIFEERHRDWDAAMK